MNGILGIVNFENDRVHVEGLSEYRTVPAMSFLGRYRVVDFTISNMVNSGIDQIKILAKEKNRSLIEHIGNGSQYDINPKHGLLQILTSEKRSSSRIYSTDVALLEESMEEILECKEDYVVITPSYMINMIDYRDVVKQHAATGADITCVFKEVTDADKHFVGCVECDFLAGDNRITEFKINAAAVSQKYISLETYVMTKDKFVEIVDTASSISSIYSLTDYIVDYVNYYNVVGYRYEGYLGCINSLQEYFYNNMQVLEYDVAYSMFGKNWPIYTKTSDSAPAFYAPTASVKNSYVANGCVIQGTVENCVVGRGVKIKKGAVVKNSILLPGAVIGENSEVDYVVVDKGAHVEHVNKLVGTADDVLYVRRKDTI